MPFRINTSNESRETAAFRILAALNVPVNTPLVCVCPAVGKSTNTAAAWLAFPGAWGEANFFHAPDPVNTRVAGSGPLGPRFHALWRDPVGTILRWPAG